MENEIKICPKCGGKMKKGWMVDTAYFGTTIQQGWSSSVKKRILGAEDYKVNTWACEQCYYLESYLARNDKKVN